MSWLYKRRHQLDGLTPLIEVAHWAVIKYHLPPEDQDDVEQEIVISLILEVEKHGNKGKNYLWAVARNRIYEYWDRKYRQKDICHIQVSEKGEKAGGAWLGCRDSDIDARLDAKATLATLPTRLIQLGYKLLEEESLRVADRCYLKRERDKLLRMNLTLNLNYRIHTKHLTDLEKRRVLKMYSEGISVTRIAKALRRSYDTIRPVLADCQLSPRQSIEMAAKERDERIRHVYFVDGKSLKQIAREFHYGIWTVRKAVGLDTRGKKSRPPAQTDR